MLPACLELNNEKSDDVNNPRFAIDADGKLKFTFAPDVVILKSVPVVPVAALTGPVKPFKLVTAPATVPND